MDGRTQRSLRRLGLAALPQEADIIFQLLPYLGRTGLQRSDRIGHQWQFLVINKHRLSRILPGSHCVGQNNRHRLTDKTHPLPRQ
jgi:hypothetical protein